MSDTLERFSRFVIEITSTTSRLEKENTLRKWASDTAVRNIIHFIFNPYIVTGMSKKKFNKNVLNDWTCDYTDIEDVIEYLESHNTGSDRDIANIQHFVLKNHEYAYLIYQIVCKDISLGIQAKTINKVWGKNFIPEFSVQLAEKYFDDPEKYLPEGTEFLISEKLDGVRCVLMFDVQSNPHFFSRSGREFLDLVDLAREASVLDKDFVYDGELLAATSGHSKDIYRDTVSITSSDGEKRNIIYNVFDLIPKNDFVSGYSLMTARERKFELHDIIENCNDFQWIKEVPTLYAGTDQTKITEWLEWARSNNKEGIMVNIANKGYECKRTRSLLKVKIFSETEAHVIDLEEGTGKNVGKLGAIVTEVKDKENRLHVVKVGSGFSDDERILYWQHPELLKDKVVEVSYFEVTTNKSDNSLSLRFPTWLGRIRNDKPLEEMNTL